MSVGAACVNLTYEVGCSLEYAITLYLAYSLVLSEGAEESARFAGLTAHSGAHDRDHRKVLVDH